MTFEDKLSIMGYDRAIRSIYLLSNEDIPKTPHIDFGVTEPLVESVLMIIDAIDDKIKSMDYLKDIDLSSSSVHENYKTFISDISDTLRCGLSDYTDHLVAQSLHDCYVEKIRKKSKDKDNSWGYFDNDLDEDDSFACPHCGRCYDDESDDIEDELDEDFSLEDDDIVSCPVCGSSAEDEEDLSCCPVCGSLLDEEGHKDTFDELIDILKDKE